MSVHFHICCKSIAPKSGLSQHSSSTETQVTDNTFVENVARIDLPLCGCSRRHDSCIGSESNTWTIATQMTRTALETSAWRRLPPALRCFSLVDGAPSVFQSLFGSLGLVNLINDTKSGEGIFLPTCWIFQQLSPLDERFIHLNSFF
jgi:hypothetical protein